MGEPEPSNVAWLEEVSEGESLFQGQAPPAPAPAAPPKKTTAKKSKKAAADSEADADADDEKPHFPGDMLEVEVAGSDGSVAWKPAKNHRDHSRRPLQGVHQRRGRFY